jgi:thiol-disulfide isomerase/thioredoxin
MISHGFKRVSFLLFFAFWFWSVQVLGAQEINYKLVPNLQQMKDSAPTPDFTLPDLAEKKVSLKDFRGKLVMLNFWATWCVPCREEMPTMERLYQEFKNKGFVIVAVNVKDKKTDALAFIKELKLTYPWSLILKARWGFCTVHGACLLLISLDPKVKVWRECGDPLTGTVREQGR